MSFYLTAGRMREGISNKLSRLPVISKGNSGCKAGRRIPRLQGPEERKNDMSNREITERDANGNVTKLTCLDAKGSPIYTHVSDWEDGRLMRKTSYGPGGLKTASFEYAYDERGNNTEGTWFSYSNGVLMKASFVYDENDRVIEKTHHGAGTVATNKTFLTYREDGKLACSEYYGVWPDSAPVYTVREYDENGFCVKSTTEDAQHRVLHYDIYTPAENGKVAEYTNFDADGKQVYRIVYYYDAEGNTVKTERYDADNNLYSVKH